MRALSQPVGRAPLDIREDETASSSRHPGGSPPLAKPASNEQVLQGTLDLLILKTLSLAPMHGWGLTHRIEQLSQDALQVGQGSIYPALVRLEQRGWIDTDWRVTENSRRAKYYRLTPAGRRAFGTEVAAWQRFVSAVGLVLAAER
jgi:PadR family transcriptional regulator PadR